LVHRLAGLAVLLALLLSHRRQLCTSHRSRADAWAVELSALVFPMTEASPARIVL
jgi:hypothetical protein